MTKAPSRFVAKMNRPNLIQRALFVTQILNAMGPTLAAAQAIQAGGKGFFNTFRLKRWPRSWRSSVAALRNGGIYKFRVAEFGSLTFDEANASESQSDTVD